MIFPLLPIHFFLQNNFILSLIIFTIFFSFLIFSLEKFIHFLSPLFLHQERKSSLAKSIKNSFARKQNLQLKESNFFSKQNFSKILQPRFLIRKKITEQIPLLIQSIGNSMRAGYSFSQSIQLISPELPKPIKSYISELEKRIHFGENINNALLNLKKSLNHPDISFFVDSTIIQLKGGGDISKIYTKLSKSIRERIKLERDLKTAVSQGKLSGYIIAAMWPLSLLLFTILSPDYISILFTSLIGRTLISTAIVLELFGFFCIHKITKLSL